VSISTRPVRLKDTSVGRKALDAAKKDDKELRMATTTTSPETSTPFLQPVEKPKGLMLKMGYAYSKRQYGKIFSPLSVFCARMPSTFTRFYGKIGSLDKKLALPQHTVKLLREQVAIVNGCSFCMDSNKAGVLAANDVELTALIEELPRYQTSPLFSPGRRAALDYATELASEKGVSHATFAELSKHYDEREICDIVWVVASEHLYNMNNIGLNIGSDGLCAATLAK
jgi:alkylhydroperoxidase family enzyme